MTPHRDRTARRSFVGRLAAGAATLGAALATGSAPLHAMAGSPDFKAARHPQDDWMDQLPGKHRFFLDAVTPNGAGGALGYANNYTIANKSGYALEAGDLARVVCLRHFATAFAFNDATWAKYGAIWGAMLGYNDPGTNAAPVRNVWNAAGLPGMQPNFGYTLDAAVKSGVHFAICDMATHFFAGQTAAKTGATADAVYGELKSNAVGNSHFVPAGIVAVNRAQERGYTFSYVG